MKIFFTKRAVKSYQLIKKNILNNWGEKVEKKFEIKTNHFLNLLENFPELGSIEVSEKEIRGVQLTAHTRIFYRVRGKKIIILFFFDVRQNPNKQNPNKKKVI